MKEYKETYWNNIEYHVIELHYPEDGKLRLKGLKLKEKAKENLYTIVRKFDKGKLVKEMFFKDGMIHNMNGWAVQRLLHSDNNHVTCTVSYWLNDKKIDPDSDEHINEKRKVWLDETLQD